MNPVRLRSWWGGAPPSDDEPPPPLTFTAVAIGLLAAAAVSVGLMLFGGC